jgi:hypothetical protein
MKKLLPFLGLCLFSSMQAQVCFQPHFELTAGSNVTAVTSADVNNDGNPDLICADFSDVMVFLGDGAGNFGTGTTYSVMNPMMICTGDFNKDGNIDLACPSPGGGSIYIATGNGDGTFNTFNSIGNGYPTACTADFNKDGNPDLAATNNSATSSVWLGDGTGAFTGPGSYGVGAGDQWICSADFNGDGNPDLATANQNANNVSVLMGNGDGTFQTKVNYSLPGGLSPNVIVTADFNGDSKTDLATSNGNSCNMSVLLNSGTGTFTAASYTAVCVGGSLWGLVPADYDSDGKMDIALVQNNNMNSTTVEVFLGDGTGAFTGSPYQFDSDFGPRGICGGDFNKDGKPDLATANFSSGTLSVLLNSPPPVVKANADNDTLCAGLPVILTGSGAATYTWTGGVHDGSPFPVTSSQTFTVTGTDANGCIDTDTIFIKVNNLPPVSFVATATFVCSGNSVTLTGSGASTYTWSGGVTDGVPFTPSPGGQSYTVTGTDANGCSKDTSVYITVNTTPTVTINSNSPVCAGDTLFITCYGASSYNWTGPGAFSSVSPAITIANAQPASSGAYTVTGSNAGCSGTATITAVVNPLPVVTASPTNTTVCLSAQVALHGGGAMIYTWSNGINNGTPFPATATQTYTVTGTDANSCKNTATATVNVVSPATPQLCMVTVDSLSLNNVIIWEKTSYTNVDTFLVYRDTANNAYGLIGKVPYDSLSMFTDTVRSRFAANGDPRASSWRYKIAIKDTCGNIGPKSPYHQSIFMQNNAGNFSWSDYKIEGQPIPVPALSNYVFKRDNFHTGNYTVIQTLSASSVSYTDAQYSTYQATADWRIETTWSISCTPSMRYGNNQIYATIVKSKSNIANNRQVGIKQLTDNNLVKIYPNPAHESITVTSPASASELIISDLIGNSVKQVPLHGEKNTIDISGLAKGVYMVQVKSGGNILSTQKIIIQ